MGCDVKPGIEGNLNVQFQSTHPHGVRLLMVSFLGLSMVFQSTHPHGVRQNAWFNTRQVGGFNPRTHMGCDGFVRSKHYLPYVSIHAPTWGATL